MVDKSKDMGKEKGLVFISYSTADVNFASQICGWLEKEHIDCWIAPRNITAGSTYGEAIINGIRRSKVMIVVFTESANKSKYVLKEVERGVSNGCVIIPVRFEKILPSDALEFFVSSDQWFNAFNPPYPSSDHLRRLHGVVRGILDNKTAMPVARRHIDAETTKKDIDLFNEIGVGTIVQPLKKNMIGRFIDKLFADKSK